ncbi:winged helix-turn-helix domain-containing protein [Temperatibacter marinus]|uniref:Winged helix-turn-helix domain-containing protein n=1 Tax=Temperatibacter marinus TaxID=1456591 RepID=A0AA52EFM7_9PROT|nr:winged helix-turn-helix domain-containing protein [Temperatibacter marinus]WND03840.1 winged helix-turn-helix domain-containing protein [Temperatibacter marinus]
MKQNQQYQLGSWIICPRTNSLNNKDDKRSLDNKSMQVLLFLMQHAGKNVTKAQIFDHVWKGSLVAEDILSVTINKIRKALGDNARSPTFIKTLPGVGYSLIADVKTVAPSAQVSSKTRKFSRISISVISLLVLVASLAVYFINFDDGTATETLPIHSIAVLPFKNHSSAQDNLHFTDGLSDAIINQLSQNNHLKVISRYSSFTYRGKYNAIDIGKALQVDTLLDGSVQTMGKQVRINVRIVSTKDGQQLWSRIFDGETDNYFKLQDTISATVQDIIQPGSDQKRQHAKPVNAQAYEWYLMGQYHWRQRNPKSLNKAVKYFKQSLELEPEYAEAHLGLGITYATLHRFSNWSEEKAVSYALPHIEKALELKPNAPAALAAKGMVLTLRASYERHFTAADSTVVQQAEQAFIQSLALEDNATTHNWYSTLLKLMGKQAQVVKHMSQAIALNPLSASLKRSYSKYLQSIGQQDAAQRMYQRAYILEPDHISHAIESTHVFRHDKKSIITIVEWQAANAELFTNCSSDEYCEQVVLAYLSIGANSIAESILAKMKAKHGHFLHSLDLINLGLKGEDQNLLPLIERIAVHRPNNQRALFNLATAQFRAEKFKQAKETILQMVPTGHHDTSRTRHAITADNYLTFVLYAATLSKLGETESANLLLDSIQAFLKLGKVFDKIQAEFTLSEINAQLNNKEKAIQHLENALNMGWLPYYDKEWWTLQNNHLLQPLQEDVEFKALLQKHEKSVNELREKVVNTLSDTAQSN